MSNIPPPPSDPSKLREWVDQLGKDDVLELARQITQGGLSRFSASLDESDQLPEVGPVPEEVRTLRIRVTLLETTPPVWRSLDVAGDLRLDRVHEVLQAAMGWSDSHLHRFHAGDERAPYFVTEFDVSEGDEGVLEDDVRLDQVLRVPGDFLTYEYDFGDGWEHRVELGSTSDGDLQVPARCVEGALACPPEDCGGSGGYADLAAWVRSGYDDSAASEYQDPAVLREWLPRGWHPDEFDVDEANQALRWAGGAWPVEVGEELRSVLDTLDGSGRVRVLGWMASPVWTRPPLVSDAAIHEAVGLWQILLEEIGSGVELTAAGYLRPSLVEQLAERTGVADWWIGKANREDLTPPIAHLRTTARALGLVTVRKGRLGPTRVGRACVDRPAELWNHVLSRLPLGRSEFERSAGWFALLVAASGQPPKMWWEATSELLEAAGWIEEGGRSPSSHSPTSQVLDVMVGGNRHRTTTGLNAAVAAAARTVVLG